MNDTRKTARVGITLLLGFALLPTFASLAVAAPETTVKAPALEAWLPEDVIAFAKVDAAGPKLREFLGSDLWKTFQKSIFYQVIESQDGFLEFKDQIDQVDDLTGKKPLKLLDSILGNGIIAGVRLSFPPEFLVITRSSDSETLQSGLEAIKEAVRAKEGAFPETAKLEHHGVTIEKIDDKVSFATIDNHFLISNSSYAVQSMVELAKGKSQQSLSRSEAFAPALGSSKKDRLITAAVLPNYLPGFLDSVPTQVNNFPGSMLLSGWFDAVRNSQLIHAGIDFSPQGVGLKLAVVARSEDELAKSADVFFPGEAAAVDAQEIGRLRKRGLVGLVHLRRDLAKWWEQREKYLDPKGLGEAIQFNTIASIFFGGRSFQDEVLPQLESGVTLVASRLAYKDLGATPNPQLPGFAAVFRLKNAEEFGRNMATAFHTTIGIINANQAQEGKGMAFLPVTEKIGGVDVITATTDKPEKGQPLGIEYNFSPSLAVVGSRVVLSSNSELTKVLVEELGAVKEPKTAASRLPTDSAHLNAAEIGSLLEANRETLVGKMMLDEGISRDEAKMRLKAIHELLGLVKSLDLTTRRHGRSLTANLKLRLAQGTPSAAEAGEKKKSTKEKSDSAKF